MFKKHLSQQGFTLVEILVSLVIASFIIGLVTSVLISTVKFNDNTQTRINLRQESNRIVTEIRAFHRKDESVCYDRLAVNSGIKMTMQLNNTDLKKGDCFAVSHSNDLPVKFTLSDGPKNSFTIDTVVEGKKGTDLSFTIPKKDSGFIDNLLLDNVFVYGSQLTVLGSSELTTPAGKEGTVVAVNPPGRKEDLVFSGGASIFSVQNIYIDKKGSEVVFENSAKLGVKNITKIVHITGNVQLNRGTARIDGDIIYIDGDVTFGNSAFIEGKKVIINGNVTFNNWTANIKADEIYIAGTIKYTNKSTNITGAIKDYSKLMKEEGAIPKSPTFTPPTLHEKRWYKDNRYEVRTNGEVSSTNRIYSDGDFKFDKWLDTAKNIIIVSERDIEFGSFTEMSGILFAPNGKVTIKGAKFTGVIIARDGISTGGNTKIEYKNASEFIKANDPIPFE